MAAPAPAVRTASGASAAAAKPPSFAPEVEQKAKTFVDALFKDALAIPDTQHYLTISNRAVDAFNQSDANKWMALLDKIEKTTEQWKQDQSTIGPDDVKQRIRVVAEIGPQRKQAKEGLPKILDVMETALREFVTFNEMTPKAFVPLKQMNVDITQLQAKIKIIKCAELQLQDLRSKISDTLSKMEPSYGAFKAALQPAAYRHFGYVTTERFSNYGTVDRLRDAYLAELKAASSASNEPAPAPAPTAAAAAAAAAAQQ